MSNVPSILIDPYVLCLSTYENKHIGFDVFVEKVTAWSELTARDDIELLFSEDCLVSMYEDGCYPEEHRIRTFYRANSRDYVDEQTLCYIVKRILESTPSLESKSNIRSVLINDTTLRIEPQVILERLRNSTKKSFKHSLNLFSVWDSQYDIEHVIGSDFKGFDESFDGYLKVKSEVHDLEHYDNTPCNMGFPVQLDCQHPIFRCFEDILKQVDIIELWDNARDEQSVISAIDTKVAILIEGGLPDERMSYKLGSNLLDSLHGWSFNSRSDLARNFIETCARIVLQQPKNPLKEFKKRSVSGKYKRYIRKIDNAIAYRTHITKRMAGYRLMMWQLPDGMIEFSNVGSKDELVIYE